MILTERLACGAELLLEPVDRTDTLCIGFWYPYGSRDEKDGEHGYCHFLEHMLFKGTRSRTAFQIAQQIDRVGGYINAFTEKETTCVYVVIPKEHIRLAYEVLTDMAGFSMLDEKEMEKEKTVVVNEILSIDDSPEEKGHELYIKELWDGHPLARKITGEVEEVEGITRAGLEGFYRSRFTPSVIAVAGNFDPAEARALSNAVYAEGKRPPEPPRRERPVTARFTDFAADRFTQAHIYAGTSYPLSRDISHYYTSLLFSTAFGESMSSRLFQKLREELGLCYSVYSFRTFFSDIGQLTIYANATPKLAGRLLEALNGELKSITRDPMSAEAIADAKSHLIGSMILSKEDMESRMKRLVRQNEMIDRVLEFEESVAMIGKVSMADVEKFVSTYLKSSVFSLLVFGVKKVSAMRGFTFDF